MSTAFVMFMNGFGFMTWLIASVTYKLAARTLIWNMRLSSTRAHFIGFHKIVGDLLLHQELGDLLLHQKEENTRNTDQPQSLEILIQRILLLVFFPCSCVIIKGLQLYQTRGAFHAYAVVLYMRLLGFLFHF